MSDDEKVYVCGCGSDKFHILYEGEILCPKCNCIIDGFKIEIEDKWKIPDDN